MTLGPIWFRSFLFGCLLAISQDALGHSARRIATLGSVDVCCEQLEDGGIALGYFNRGETPQTFPLRLESLWLGPSPQVRDVWRQKDLAPADGTLQVSVPGHDVMLYRITPAASASGK